MARPCVTVPFYASLKFTQLQFDARVVCGLLSTLAQLPELGTGERHLEPERHSGQEQDSWKELPLRLTEMALALWKNFLQITMERILQQRRLSLYNGADGYEEELIKKKLQQFSGGSIIFSKEDNGIAILTLNNPKLMNAFTGTMMVELQERVTELENWKDGKGLIIHGAGNTFCSGSDLNVVKEISNSQDGMNMCMFMQNTLTRLMRLPLISVALVQGKAFGGGAELTTACDFRLMTPGSEIRFVHKHMGLVPGWGGGARLVRIVGSGAALQLLGGAARVDPERALSLGLSEETLLSSDETRALGEARAWLSRYTEGPAAVIRAVKKVVAAGRELPLEAALRTEKDILGTVWGGPANLEALVRRPKHK
ncbi:ethylmalonyl-CoA decarboxylase isoform X1 [Vidua chalybeata]|uniref:ethylmalonyl-CoA decarboxylase isoform X1 n=2 Tax=Vidua chalybeata TaxID=81927 RepID=UPI0023A8C5CF|nr:ethylmalonyl-CoA decarboxylase isoform X1 [Vidua chalybeata]